MPNTAIERHPDATDFLCLDDLHAGMTITDEVLHEDPSHSNATCAIRIAMACFNQYDLDDDNDGMFDQDE